MASQGLGKCIDGTVENDAASLDVVSVELAVPGLDDAADVGRSLLASATTVAPFSTNKCPWLS